MSYRCSKCERTWWPFQAPGGVCPSCGGGTRRVQENGDSARLRVRDKAGRDADRELAELEALGELPTVEPKRVPRELRNGDGCVMTDVVVTVPKRLWAMWLGEGDLAGNTNTPARWGGLMEYGFTMGSTPPRIEPGERVYVVAHGALRGWAPLVATERDARRFGGKKTDFALVRRGGAVACTLHGPDKRPLAVRGFQGFRYRWWDRADERPFPDWRTALDGAQARRPAATLDQVVTVIRSHRFHHATEDELQEGIAAALVDAGYRVEREARLSARDRIDLLVDAIGVEVKVAGIPRDVDHQLARYAASPRVTGLVLVTNRARHRPAAELNGKPVVVVSLLGSGL